jgi:hypothetical protein
MSRKYTPGPRLELGYLHQVISAVAPPAIAVLLRSRRYRVHRLLIWGLVADTKCSLAGPPASEQGGGSSPWRASLRATVWPRVGRVLEGKDLESRAITLPLHA